MVQIVNLAMATAVYLPFLKAQDNALLKEEMGETEPEESEASPVRS